MASGRGEFTRKFDRDILGDATAEEEERVAQEEALKAEDSALEEEFQKILAVLDYRAKWLTRRFPECKNVDKLDFRGRKFEFSQGGQLRGTIQFQTRLTESLQGITVESTMDLEGAFPRRHDYVNFPKERVQIDRVKRFVETKLMQFAADWQDRYGTPT
ncbi:MAG: hypothetical protein JKY65_02700 [Planctomycetes bacterium]|nr:hypothetical protein [Planctomycetota bacterium]